VAHQSARAFTSLSVAAVAVLGLWTPTSATAVVRSSVAAATALPPESSEIWVANEGVDAIVGYPAGSKGDATPTVTIAGADTGLNAPTDIAVTANGTVWVSNFLGNSLTSYPPGAHGDATPAITIVGASTGLNEPAGLALASNGDVWVVDQQTSSVALFAAGANGDAAPIATISGGATGIGVPTGVALTPDGNDIWVISRSGSSSLLEFPVTANGDVAPIATIVGPDTLLVNPQGGLVLDAAGRIHVEASDGVLTFPANSSGDAVPTQIAGASTGFVLPRFIALDAAGGLWVADSSATKVSRFTAATAGDVAPVASITGADTTLSAPWGVAVYAAAPGIPRSLAGHGTKHKVSLTWKPPTATGGGVVGYHVARALSRNGPWTVIDTTSKTSYIDHGRTDGKRYFFEVRSFNDLATSGPSLIVGVTAAATPSAPRSVTTVAARTSIRVRWTAPAHDGGASISGYIVSYAVCKLGRAGCHAHHKAVGGKTHHTKLTKLRGHHRYYLTVAARNSSGEGAESARASARPLM
jgi:hypothetical protein